MKRTRRSTNVLGKALGALGLVLALGSLQGCVVAARGQFRTTGTVAYEAPPPPREEVYQARGGHVWVKGRWDWQSGGWQWVPGHWERERAGYGYQEGRWDQRDNQWHYTEGTWIVVNGGGTVTTGGGGHGRDHHDHDRDQVRDHRDGQHGTVVVGGSTGGGSSGPLVGSTGIVVVGSGGVVLTGPGYAPPPRRTESYGAARGGHVWISGNWQWSNGQYEWVPGHWEREKAGHQWYDGEWRAQGNTWVWFQGEWRMPAPQVQGTGTIRVRDRRTN